MSIKNKTLPLIKGLGPGMLVAVLFVASRLPYLGYDNFNTDVWRWKQRIYDFGSGVFNLEFEKTIQMYHPGVTLMWLGALAVKVYNVYYDITTGANPPDNQISTVFELDFVQKLFIVFGLALTTACVFAGLRKLFGTQLAALAVFLISIEPFYLALTRVIHLEGLMSTFLIASFVWLYVFTEGRSRRSLVASAIFASLALLTKSSSLFILPFAALVLVVGSKAGLRKAVSGSIKPYLAWLAIAVLGFLILWPGMWVAPLKALEAYKSGAYNVGVEGGHEQLYFGSLVDDPGPLFYFVVLLFRSSVHLLVGLLGLVVIGKLYGNDTERRFIVLALLFAILYLVEITIPTKKLDRYILPVICSLVLASAFSFNLLLRKLRLRFSSFGFVAFSLLFVPQVLSLVLITPDYFSYYNPLGGGLSRGIYILEPKWLFGQRQLVNYFQRKMVSGSYKPFGEGESLYNMKRADYASRMTVAFPEKYYTQMWPFLRKMGGWAVMEHLTPEAVKTNFFVWPVWDDYSGTEDRFKLEHEGTIKVDGVDVYRVYRRIG